MKRDTLSCDVSRVILKYFEDLDTPHSLAQAIRLRYGDWVGILESAPDPRSYLNQDRYFRDIAASAILKKCAGLPTGIDTRQRAIEKWREGEVDCFRTNERLTRYLPENFAFSDRDERISEFFRDVKEQIVSWIGPTPPSDLLGKFGPGATATDRGWNVTIPHKMSSVPSFTRESLQFLPSWAQTAWGRAISSTHGEVQVVRGNRFTTVPKTAKTDRSIASEPSVNIFYQLAIGRCLKRRLFRSTGWRLEDAPETHKRIARESSRTSEFATLDLSNASDTLSSTLVRLVMPRRWFQLLDSLRSRMTEIDGKWVLLEKFSSMGNGFTFELETLIFAAISCVVSRRHGHNGRFGQDVFVFGDDIIVKDDVGHSLLKVLNFCGFKSNPEKTFIGRVPFRESCGGDYYNGLDSRAHYLKEFPREPQHWISFANGVNRVRDRLDPSGVCWRSRAWLDILERIPSRIRRCRGPQALGDVVIHDERSRWSVRQRNSRRYFEVYRPFRHRLVRWDRFDPEVVLACATYGTGGGIAGGVIPRDSVLSYKVGWMAYS